MDHSQAFSAVTSDVSATGIGLLAAVEANEGPVQITIDEEERQVILRAHIRWTERIGAGFYRIGMQTTQHAQLVGPDTAANPSLSVVKK